MPTPKPAFAPVLSPEEACAAAVCAEVVPLAPVDPVDELAVGAALEDCGVDGARVGVGAELLEEEELSCSANVSAKSGRIISAS
jgi:hypothetical protein